MQESSQGISLSTIYVFLICRKYASVFVQTLQQYVGVGNGVVHLCPDVCHNAFTCRVLVFETPEMVIVAHLLGPHILLTKCVYHTVSEMCAVETFITHLGINACKLVFETVFSTEQVIVLHFRLRADIQPVLARCGAKNQADCHSAESGYNAFIFH